MKRLSIGDRALIGVAAFAVTAAAACGDSSSPPATANAGGFGSTSVGTTGGVSLNGAGATFPAPLYSEWAGAYKVAKRIEVNYAAVGSGGGIKQIVARTVDFGASDDAMSVADLQKEGLVQFPAAIGGVVLAYSLSGFSGDLKLDGPTVANIYRGGIKKWNAPEIKALNPSASLPATDITPVYRSDSSGTSAIFTTYLSDVSAAWKSEIGADKSVKWPAGVGGKGNAGVAGFLKQIPGSIGYVEYSYAKSNNLPVAMLKNAAGQFVQASSASFEAAAANAKWDPSNGFDTDLNNQSGADSWPIVGVSFILVPAKPSDATKAREVLKFFDFAMTDGGAAATKLDYVPLPPSLSDQVRASWASIKGPDGRPVLE
jgi:phosphate transport system substrate-binding protein